MNTRIRALAISAVMLQGCASWQTAKDFRLISFEEKTTPSKSIGQVKGQDCTWYVMGWGLGEEANVRLAFINAAEQKEQSLIPGEKATQKGDPLKMIKNVSVENSGFNVWVLSRQCVSVTGMGYL